MKTYTIRVSKCEVLEDIDHVTPQDVCDDCERTNDIRRCRVQVEVINAPGCVGGDVRYLCPACRKEIGS